MSSFINIVERFIKSTHPEEEGKFSTVKSHPEKLGLKSLLLHDVVIIRCLHFLHKKTLNIHKRLAASSA